MNKINRKAQIWIETVLYTVIILAIISLVLSFSMPAITKQKEQAIVQQSIDSMKTFDEKIRETQRETGNVRILDYTLREGDLYIDGDGNNITLTINDLSNLYSQPGIAINDGNVKIISEEGKKKQTVNIILNYGFNITYNGQDTTQKFSPAKIPYKFSIENNGDSLDIKEVSQG
jgi:hypothetical protein